MLLGNFQCWSVLLVWMIVRQEPTVLVVSADWGCLEIFLLPNLIYFLSPLREMAQYRLKYCLRGP